MPPKKKQTKRKTDQVDNVPANKEVKQEEDKKDHYYFEPRLLSDVEIVYKGTTFHMHKVLLIQKSIYFKRLLYDTNKECKYATVYPLVEPIYGDAIGEDHLKVFFDFLYRESPMKSQDYDCTDECPDGLHDCLNNNLNVLSWGLLFHFFEMESYQKCLEKLVTEVDPATSIDTLMMVCRYGDQKAKDLYIDKVSSSDTFWLEIEWKMVPEEVKELVYQRKIAHCMNCN